MRPRSFLPLSAICLEQSTYRILFLLRSWYCWCGHGCFPFRKLSRMSDVRDIWLEFIRYPFFPHQPCIKWTPFHVPNSFSCSSLLAHAAKTKSTPLPECVEDPQKPLKLSFLIFQLNKFIWSFIMAKFLQCNFPGYYSNFEDLTFLINMYTCMYLHSTLWSGFLFSSCVSNYSKIIPTRYQLHRRSWDAGS